MSPLTKTALLAAVSAPLAAAWGTLGHDTVAYVATDFVTADTKAWAQGILGDNSSNYMASVATWADEYRYTSAGKWSAGLHYIDAKDNPPKACNVDYDRDCHDAQCIIGAIGNFTQQVQDKSLDKEQVTDALKFLIHFLGDIHQPLHDEALDIGGNDIDVKYGSEDTNLHHVWDTNIPESYTGGYAMTDARKFATQLTAAIKNGTWTDSGSWLDDMDIDDAKASSLAWAADANKRVCDTVMPDGVKPLESADLSGDYYGKALPVVQEQLAKAGYRLAAWLNLIATGSKGIRHGSRHGSN